MKKVVQKPKKKNVCLGPVQCLEEHVKIDWWARIFNSMYLKTDADVVEDTDITKMEIDLFIDILKPEIDDRILDICCGQGRHTFEMGRRGYMNVEGIDRSRYLIQKARNRAKQEGLNIRFREGDARKLPFPNDRFDITMILGNSFGYFESPDDDVRVMKNVLKIMKPGARILIDIADGNYLKDNFSPRSWEWIDSKMFVCRERMLSEDSDRLISREVISHSEKGVIVDQFYAERLYTRESLQKVFEKAGFSNIVFHSQINPESKRNQDLGMMAQRFIVTAEAVKEKTSVSIPAGRKLDITVLMGDPCKYDSVKPNGVFDSDDMETIEILKKTMGTMDEEKYKFSYFDAHDEILDKLMEIKENSDLVLNFCDEGFMNRPGMEMHIPALLELTGIKYTGAGPQCLAKCYDKSLVLAAAADIGIPIAEHFIIEPGTETIDVPLRFPVIVKPNFADASIGITETSVVYDAENLISVIPRIREQFKYNGPFIVEEFLPGKDMSVGIVGNINDLYEVLPVLEEDYSCLPDDRPRICGYEAKWYPESPYWAIKSKKADIPDDCRDLMTFYSLKIFERMECRDYARIDWRMDENGNPRMLEVNPNPGWCWDGHLARMAQIRGISYKELLEMIISAAVRRLF